MIQSCFNSIMKFLISIVLRLCEDLLLFFKKYNITITKKHFVIVITKQIGPLTGDAA